MILVNRETHVDHAKGDYGVAENLTLSLRASVQCDRDKGSRKKSIDVDRHPADAEADGGIGHAEKDQYNGPRKCGTFTEQSGQAAALPPAIKSDQSSKNRHVGCGVEFGEWVAAGLV